MYNEGLTIHKLKKGPGGQTLTKEILQSNVSTNWDKGNLWKKETFAQQNFFTILQGVGDILTNGLQSGKLMTLKYHSYKENNNTRFSFRFGKLLMSTSNTTLKCNDLFSMENISIRNSCPKVSFINYSSGNYGKLLEKY